MWAAIIRAAAGFAATMLFSSFLKIAVSPHVIPILENKLGSNALLVRSIEGVIQWLPVIAFITIVVALIARGLAEQRLPG